MSDLARWGAAIPRYRAKRDQQAQQAAQATAAAELTAHQKEEERRRYEDAVHEASQGLRLFLASEECKIAQALLEASGRHVVIVEENEGGGSGVVYFLDRNGLQQSLEAMGQLQIYARPENVPKPKISPADPRDVAALAIRLGAHPAEIVGRIRLQLNRIADEGLR